MDFTPHTKAICQNCSVRNGRRFDPVFSMAFQPIFDAVTGEVYAHEALARMVDGGGVSGVISQVTHQNRYSFDQTCRSKAIELASRLGVTSRLSINCMPNAVLDPLNCLRTTIIAARRYDFPVSKIIFEFSETDQIEDIDQFRQLIAAYRHLGFQTAFDDFGAGYAGLGLLSDIQPDIVKLDMRLVRGIDQDRARALIVDACLHLCMKLEIEVIAEGVETREEFVHLRDAGVRLFQGYLFGKPAFEGLLDRSEVALPDAA